MMFDYWHRARSAATASYADGDERAHSPKRGWLEMLGYVALAAIAGAAIAQPAAAASAPTVKLHASPESVASGGSSTLSWSSSGATSCSAAGDWSGTLATSGSKSTGAL